MQRISLFAFGNPSKPLGISRKGTENRPCEPVFLSRIPAAPGQRAFRLKIPPIKKGAVVVSLPAGAAILPALRRPDCARRKQPFRILGLGRDRPNANRPRAPNDDAHPEHMRSLRKSATSGRLRLFFLGARPDR